MSVAHSEHLAGQPCHHAGSPPCEMCQPGFLSRPVSSCLTDQQCRASSCSSVLCWSVPRAARLLQAYCVLSLPCWVCLLACRAMFEEELEAQRAYILLLQQQLGVRPQDSDSPAAAEVVPDSQPQPVQEGVAAGTVGE